MGMKLHARWCRKWCIDSDSSPPPPPPPPQQVDQLLVAKMLESVSTATTSLVSLVKLLDKVKNMVISDLIQQEVWLSPW